MARYFKIILKLIEHGGNIQHYKEEARGTIRKLYEPPQPRKMKLIIINDKKDDDKSVSESSKLTTILKSKAVNNRVILPKANINTTNIPSSPKPKIIMPKIIKKDEQK